MYKRFYGLTRSPFELSPDPYFFYPTPLHNEAFAVLNYCILRRKGFVVVSGEVGTGKTLLLRCLLDALNRNQIASAFVYNPRLSVSEFLAYVLTDLHLPLVGRTKGEMLSYLNNYLLDRSRRGTTTVLIVDEAQLLSWDLLEEIRLLTNLETSQHKLLQIVLVGQPELDRKIDSNELRQLKQRIAMRCRLEPLGLKDLRGYIRRRLELAGGNSGATIFPNEAIVAILSLNTSTTKGITFTSTGGGNLSLAAAVLGTAAGQGALLGTTGFYSLTTALPVVLTLGASTSPLFADYAASGTLNFEITSKSGGLGTDLLQGSLSLVDLAQLTVSGFTNTSALANITLTGGTLENDFPGKTGTDQLTINLTGLGFLPDLKGTMATNLRHGALEALPTPEPWSMLLYGSGLVLIGFILRRRLTGAGIIVRT